MICQTQIVLAGLFKKSWEVYPTTRCFFLNSNPSKMSQAVSNMSSPIKVKLKINSSQSGVDNAFFIEGGGTKGVHAIGVIKYMFDHPGVLDLRQVKVFGGTSVGSYLATALSLGLDSADMSQLIEVIDIGGLIESKYWMPLTLYRLTSKGYLYDDAGRRRIAESVINLKIDRICSDLKKAGIDDTIDSTTLTFGHLSALVKNYPNIYKDLLINAVDINRHSQVFMTSLDGKWSNISILDAMLASSAIPFVFKPTEFHYEPYSGLYHPHPIDNSLPVFLVDGATSTNNPLDYFLLNPDYDYHIWLLKFTAKKSYIRTRTNLEFFRSLIDYLIGGKNDLKAKLLSDKCAVNVINLKSTAGTLDLYTTEEIKEIVKEIYLQCCDGRFDWCLAEMGAE
jgi:predicted acylesterase/phospholipase RssA